VTSNVEHFFGEAAVVRHRLGAGVRGTAVKSAAISMVTVS